MISYNNEKLPVSYPGGKWWQLSTTFNVQRTCRLLKLLVGPFFEIQIFGFEIMSNKNDEWYIGAPNRNLVFVRETSNIKLNPLEASVPQVSGDVSPPKARQKGRQDMSPKKSCRKNRQGTFSFNKSNSVEKNIFNIKFNKKNPPKMIGDWSIKSNTALIFGQLGQKTSGQT